MNISNAYKKIDTAIAIMRRAKNVDMREWQSGEVVFDEAELHECGNAACFAGHIAVSPEFQADGGIACWKSGMPIIDSYEGADAIKSWFGFGFDLYIEFMVYGSIDEEDRFCDFYGKKFSDVTADDVIQKLVELKAVIKEPVIKYSIEEYAQKISREKKA